MTKQFFLPLIILFLSCSSFAQGSSSYAEWINKANAFYQGKQYPQAGEAFSKAFAANGGKGTQDDRYNAACVWSLAGVNDSAFFQLERIATRINYADYDHLTTDKDLDNLHKDKRWGALCALVKQNKEKAESSMNRPLAAMLDTLLDEDQGGRRKDPAWMKKHGVGMESEKALWEKVAEVDSMNILKLEPVLQQYGWLGSDVVGTKGNEAIFMVIQHAGIKIQDKYLPVMREAVKNKKAWPNSLALLEDRVAMRHGKKQVYGSQVLSDPQGSFLSPLEDPDNVDKRRADVGLEPLAAYLKYFGLTWNLEEYKKQLPALIERQSKMQFR